MTVSFTKVVLLTGFVVIQTQSLFADTCLPWQEGFSSKSNLVVGKIDVEAGDVFDTRRHKENKAIHRLANRIHTETKPYVIERQLLFSTGQRFNARKLRETERNLRKQRYLKGAKVVPIELCGNNVHVLVKTRDNWTLTPGVKFGRAGGETRLGVEVEENNLFGLGKSLVFSYNKDSTRDKKRLSYIDSQLFGTRKRLKLSLLDNSDGKGYEFDLGLPFYELDSKRAWGINNEKLKQTVAVYGPNNVADNITEENAKQSVFYGWSEGLLSDESVVRYKVGWTHDKTDYLNSSLTGVLNNQSTTESYPWFERSKSKQRFVKKTNFKTMGKIEDIPLGETFTTGIGLLHKSVGSDNNYAKLSASYSKGYEVSPSALAFLKVSGLSYLGNGPRKGTSLDLNLELDHFNPTGNDFHLAGEFAVADNQKRTEQFVLGGLTGLRGYPNNYQAGNKSLSVHAEKRFHFKWYPLHIMKFGAVAFTDVGTVWGNGAKRKLLADVGLGLRVIPTRSSSAKTLHLDLGFPLLNKTGIDKYQLTVRTSTSF